MVAIGIVSGVSGCGYSIRAPYDKNVHTVFVPVIRSQSFRRDVNLQLTDLLIKEIERRTPYKVVGTATGADTILDCSINYAEKNIIVENPNNLPRQLSAMISANVNWTHNPPTEAEAKRGPVLVSEFVTFVPEVGETAMTGFYRAAQSLAMQIVDMMEQPWQGGDSNLVPIEVPADASAKP